MKFCKHLLTDLNIEPGYLLPCCVGGEKRPALPFTGGAIDVAAYRDFIRRVVDIVQYNEAICSGCPYLFETEEIPAPDVYDNIRFKLVAINHHRHICNCKCVYCPFWNTGDKSKVPDILPSIKSLMEQDALLPDCNINWGGGEPTILPEFEHASAWIQEQGYWQSVHTNALRISPAIQSFLSQGRGSVNISLDSGTAATYEAVKGVNGWARVLKTLEAYRSVCKNPRALEVKYLIFTRNNNPDDINAFFDLCVQMDIQHIMYSFEGSEVSTGRLHRDTVFAAALFTHLAAEKGIHCTNFYVSEGAKRAVQTMRNHCFGQDPV